MHIPGMIWQNEMNETTVCKGIKKKDCFKINESSAQTGGGSGHFQVNHSESFAKTTDTTKMSVKERKTNGQCSAILSMIFLEHTP